MAPGTEPEWGTKCPLQPSQPLTVETAALETVTLDLYRDIHKGIRYGSSA